MTQFDGRGLLILSMDLITITTVTHNSMDLITITWDTITSQGGGIHTEEEFDPCIRVCCLFSPGK